MCLLVHFLGLLELLSCSLLLSRQLRSALPRYGPLVGLSLCFLNDRIPAVGNGRTLRPALGSLLLLISLLCLLRVAFLLGGLLLVGLLLVGLLLLRLLIGLLLLLISLLLLLIGLLLGLVLSLLGFMAFHAEPALLLALAGRLGLRLLLVLLVLLRGRLLVLVTLSRVTVALLCRTVVHGRLRGSLPLSLCRSVSRCSGIVTGHRRRIGIIPRIGYISTLLLQLVQVVIPVGFVGRCLALPVNRRRILHQCRSAIPGVVPLAQGRSRYESYPQGRNKQGHPSLSHYDSPFGKQCRAAGHYSPRAGNTPSVRDGSRNRPQYHRIHYIFYC